MILTNREYPLILNSYTSKQVNLPDGRAIPVGRGFYKDIVKHKGA